MLRNNVNSELLLYLIDRELKPGARLPALTELSEELGLSVGKLREQLEVARQLGFVSVRPRLGTRREPFSFYPAVQSSLMFGLATGEANFAQFSQLRQTLEANMWHPAVAELQDEDLQHLHELLAQAKDKLHGSPVHIPNGEHRDLHLTFFSRLNNPFVQALLQAYWDAYEATELTRFADYQYWLDVWSYHEQIVDAICGGEIERGRQILIEHFQLLPTVTLPRQTSPRVLENDNKAE
ncbi:MAG: FCD domain-containing protein [Chloroflexota bacterium]|jgi:DNA-binding FadR family transcriptional regulator